MRNPYQVLALLSVDSVDWSLTLLGLWLLVLTSLSLLGLWLLKLLGLWLLRLSPSCCSLEVLLTLE